MRSLAAHLLGTVFFETGAVPLQQILRPGRPQAESLAEVLTEAARTFEASLPIVTWQDRTVRRSIGLVGEPTVKSSMKFGYTIIYVPNVKASLQFFEQAFGFSKRFLHESGTYGELESGGTTLAFAAHELASANFEGGHVSASESTKPLGMELGFVTDDVESAHSRALAAGAIELAPPRTKPWGQVVSYLRCPDGALVELCSPIGA